MKAEEARQGTVEKSSFSWRLSSKSTSTILHRRPYVLVALLSSLLRQIRSFLSTFFAVSFVPRTSIGLSRLLLRFIKYVTSLHRCVLVSSEFLCFLLFSLPLSFSSSLLYRATGLNHCFLSLSYSRRSADSALHSNCCSSRLIPCIVRRTIAIISSLDASRNSSLRIRFRSSRLICFDVRTRSLMKMPVFTRLCYEQTYDIVRDSLQRLVCSMSILIYSKSRETGGYMISKFGECFSDTN